MTKTGETERLIKEIKAFRQEQLEAAYALGQCLLQLKDHESHERFVKILGDFGLTEIEGEAIYKNMRIEGKPEAAAKIAGILLNASMRFLENMEKENADG